MRKALSIMMMISLLPLAGCTAKADHRTGEADGYGGKVKVSVTMNGTDITEVKVTEHSETPGVGTRAIEALPERIVQADSIDVDGVSGATVTSEAIKQAVGQAMGMAGLMQQVIPMDGANASEAVSARGKLGVGLAVTGRVGPGKDSEGKQVYSMNAVFASGEFDGDGTIWAIRVDQLEVVSPNLGGGNRFSGFPQEADSEEAFLAEVSAWQTKGALGGDYMLQSGSWREQMDEYERLMVGKTVDEVKEWYQSRGDAADGADAETSATMSLQGEYGDILLAIERAWQDAKDEPAGERKDTNSLTDAAEGEKSEG